jgi:uncharacterized protein YkwD
LKQYTFLRRVALGFITVSLLTTSLGAFATVAQASPFDANVQEEKNADNISVVHGILALGLIGLVSGHGGSKGDGSLTKGATSTTVASTPTAPVATAVTATTSTEEALALNLLNADRSKHGLRPLKHNSQLATLGQKYAKDMIQRKFFAHTNPDGLSPFDRMKKAGIAYGYAGENLAINTNVNTAENAFMNSSGHRANILSPNYTDVGIGVAHDARGSAYVVQEFISK